MRNSGIGYKGATFFILTIGTPFCAKFKDASQAFPYTAFALRVVMAVFENRQKKGIGSLFALAAKLEDVIHQF